MTPRAARLLAIPFVLLAFVLRLLVESRVAVPGHSVALNLGATVVSFAVPFGGYLLPARQARVRPVTWLLDPAAPGFAGVPSPYHAGPLAILLGWLGGSLAADDIGSLWLQFGPPAVVVLGAILLLVVDRPTLTLTPAGLLHRSLWRRTELPWDGTSVVPPDRDRPRSLLIRGPGEAHRRRLTTRDVHVDPQFLFWTVAFYVVHPEHRADIGTTPGLRILTEAFRHRADEPGLNALFRS